MAAKGVGIVMWASLAAAGVQLPANLASRSHDSPLHPHWPRQPHWHGRVCESYWNGNMLAKVLGLATSGQTAA